MSSVFYAPGMTESTNGSRGPRGPYAKGVARRQEILDSAIAVFATRGAGRTSLRAIAQEVGVTHAALIHHFGSLDRLLVEVYRASEQQADRMGVAPDGLSPVDVMRRSAQHNRDVPGLVQLYTTLTAAALEEGHPAATAFVGDRFAALRRSLAEEVRLRQADGGIRPDVDADAVAALVIAASDGLQTQWLLDPTLDQVAALDLLDRLLSEPR